MKGDKNLVSTYTSNQTGAIATLLAAALWGLTDLGISVKLDLHSTAMITFIAIFDLLIWILVVLYIKRIQPAFLVGIVIGIIAMISFIVTPETPWYTFSDPVYDFSSFVAFLFGPAFIYFSYKSYQEL